MQTDRSRFEHLRNDREPWRPRPTLGGDDYTSLEVYQQEREKIWWGDWVCAGRTEEVAGAGDYIVARHRRRIRPHHREQAGELHGFYNVCSHRGTKFVDDIEGRGTFARRSCVRTTRGRTTSTAG